MTLSHSRICAIEPFAHKRLISQVEDTLNNSNDLFLTFRKEMEEMSKKTKRLEKENHTLSRKHDQTNHNILQMAEERTRSNREMEMLRKKNVNLEKLCRGMQDQGRGQIGSAKDTDVELDSEGTESDNDYEGDLYEGSDGNEVDVDVSDVSSRRKAPTDAPPEAGKARANGHVNGITPRESQAA